MCAGGKVSTLVIRLQRTHDVHDTSPAAREVKQTLARHWTAILTQPTTQPGTADDRTKSATDARKEDNYNEP